MKKNLLLISLLIGTMALTGCGSDDSSDGGGSDSSSSSASASSSGTSSSSGSASESSGESVSKLHIDDASDLYGYTIKAKNNNTVVTHTIDCSGSFVMSYSVDGTVYPSFGYQGDTIDVSRRNENAIGVDFIGVDSDGDERDSGFVFKNEDGDIVVGQTNYDGMIELLVSSIVKDSSCN